MSTAAAVVPAVQRNRRKVRIGKVISNKMQKSIVVSLERKIPHPLYKKYYKQTSTLMAHDEKQEARIGDVVRVMETRPVSKRKRWRLVEVVEKAK
jgi:small subunit ribosomal protein S17